MTAEAVRGTGDAARAGDSSAQWSSPDAPRALHELHEVVKAWLSKGRIVWIDGEITSLSRKGGRFYGTLADPGEKADITINGPGPLADELEAMGPGARVVVEARVQLWGGGSKLALQVRSVRHVGLGQRLAELERLRARLDAEGLFDPSLRKALPFLPVMIGVITGRASDAEHDIRENIANRWPAARLQVVNVATQGTHCVPEVIEALAMLDADPEVDVIIIARGGGSTEDLLPFSEESLVRAAFAAETPIVSAIGHEKDAPLLDFVADLRASTPTDAAKRVVPDLLEQQALIGNLRHSAFQALTTYLNEQRASVALLRQRSGISSAIGRIDDAQQTTLALRDRARAAVRHAVAQDASEVQHLLARVVALSPAQTLARGYAVLQDQSGHVVRSPEQVSLGDVLQARLADGTMTVQRVGDDPGRTTRPEVPPGTAPDANPRSGPEADQAHEPHLEPKLNPDPEPDPKEARR